jgi:hypothetical protein
MKIRLAYYIFKDAVQKNERDITLEFEVWARIIRDSDGRDVQVFVKEDKRNGLRKDSSFYYNGYWEVFEFDDAARETRFRTSSGISSLSRYDDKERLKEYYRTDEGDTLESQRYEWKNGRLVRMTANGVVRNYIYGKTLSDTVRVVPSDEGFNYHRGYNGTAGKIPEEGTLDYETFSRSPYGHVAFGEEEKNEYEESSPFYFAAKNSAPENSGSLNVLGKTVTQGCISKENYLDDMPEPQCVRFQKNDIPANLTRKEAENLLKYGYPCGENSPSYGRSDFKLSLSHTCNCNASGEYQPYFIGKVIKPFIEVYQNSLVYESSRDDWRERCWRRDDLLMTYIHETKHVRNARIFTLSLNSFASKSEMKTKEECEKNAAKDHQTLEKKWNEWYINEQYHVNPNSPKYTGPRPVDVCR